MQFLFPTFLYLITAVAVPVVIHLSRLRRPRHLVFTNTSFIKEASLTAARFQNVKHLLILIARVLGISAIVFAFSQPFISAQNDDFAKAENISIKLDNSSSMQTSGVEGTLLEEGVFRARNVIEGYDSDTRFKLIGRKNNTITKSEIELELSLLKSKNNESGVLDFIKMVDSHSMKGPTYIFSDFQKSNFNPKLLSQIVSNQKLIFIPLLKNKTGNIYIDSIWINDDVVRSRTNISLYIRLRNGGDLQVDDCPVKVILGNKQVATYRTTVKARQAVTKVVQIQIGEGNVTLGKIVTDDTSVRYDNTYYFTMQPAAPIQVLEVGENPVAQHVYANEPLFNYQFTKPQLINYEKLSQANVLLLGEVPQIELGLREGISALLKRGGSVVIVPPAEEKNRSHYQQLFKGLGLGTVQWETLKEIPEGREVKMPSRQETFFQNVFGAQQKVVTMPRVTPVLRWSRTGRDILRLQDGESYLAEFASGSGRVYVFSAPFDPAYSDFVEHALFVPVMYRMAMLSYRNEQRPAYRLDQRTVNFTLLSEGASGDGSRGGNGGLRLVKDSLTLIPAQRVQGKQVQLDVPSEMDTPGFYQVQRAGKTLTTLAFNGNKRESELAAYSAAELRAIIGPNRPNVRVVEDGPKGEALAALHSGQAGQPLWRYFLALALVALLAEALLIRFGISRKPAQEAGASL